MSFASARYAPALRRIVQQARKSGWFGKIFARTPETLSTEFYATFPEWLTSKDRGYGLWTWKPGIILEALEALPKNDFLLYADAGCHINPRGRAVMKAYCEEIMSSSSELMAFELDQMERHWTRKELARYFGLDTNHEIMDSGQRAAGVILVRNSPGAWSFLKTWHESMAERPELVQDPLTRDHEEAGFRAHRHDQSFFSLLSKLGPVTARPAAEIEGWEHDFRLSRLNFPVQARRDRGGFLHKASRFARGMRQVTFPR